MNGTSIFLRERLQTLADCSGVIRQATFALVIIVSKAERLRSVHFESYVSAVAKKPNLYPEN